MSNNETLKEFKRRQEESKNRLTRLLHFVQKGREFGVEIDRAFEEKIIRSIEGIGNEKLKIALVGGFSEGKTSIAAAWLERFDKETMKIDHRESSDEIKIYQVGDDLELIDTPGLFGFKERECNGEIEQYKEMTKKYISEAHLILYVLNPANPIKESHKDTLQWMFRDLKLLARTVFVLGKFDEETDLESESDYETRYQIKKQNIIDRLNGMIGLSEDEKRELAIVAVSANPFGEGIEYWLQHREEFMKLSHIGNLQNATKEKIAKNGGIEAMDYEKQTSIVCDILSKQLPVAKKEMEGFRKIISELQKMSQSTDKEQNKLSRDISEARTKLKEFTMRYFDDLILTLRGTSLETFEDFVIENIGDGGINIETRIQNEFEKYQTMVSNEFGKINEEFKLQTNDVTNSLIRYGKQGVDFIQKSGLVNAGNILAARDFLSLPFKFKPWGAVNLAKNINTALPILGLAFEVWDSYNNLQKESEFEKLKADMQNKFNEQKKEVIELLNDENFIKDFFPQMSQLTERLDNIREQISEAQRKERDFDQWLKDGEVIEGEILSQGNPSLPCRT